LGNVVVHAGRVLELVAAVFQELVRLGHDHMVGQAFAERRHKRRFAKDMRA
jgi:hypothetical protein